MTTDAARQHAHEAPGALQGWILISAAWLAVAVAGVLAPVLPKMAASFVGIPLVDLKISLVATIPALFVALLAIPFGLLADRIGQRQVLLGAAVCYGVVGTAPLWLPTLDAIIISRVLIGIAEAAIMTCSTAMIADYFHGKQRERWLAMQTGTATLFAIIVTIVGGTLGQYGWRAPFLIYGLSFVLVPLIWFYTWTPEHRLVEAQPTAVSEPFRWGPSIGIAAVTAFGLSAFFVPIIQLSFLLTERGVVEPKTIGLWSALAALANPLGSTLFGLTHWKTRSRLFTSFVFFSVGFTVMAFIQTAEAAVGGAAIANLGAGFMFPTLITWALSSLPAAQRGRGTGLWTTGNFIGQFASPLLILYVTRLTGSRSNAVAAFAVACGIAAMLALAKREHSR